MQTLSIIAVTFPVAVLTLLTGFGLGTFKKVVAGFVIALGLGLSVGTI